MSMKIDENQDLKGKINPWGRFQIKSLLGAICSLALLSFLLFFFANHVVCLFLSLSLVPENLPRLWPFSVYFFDRVTIFTLEKEELFWYFVFIVACIFLSIFWMIIKDIKEAMQKIISAIRFTKPLQFDSKNSIILVGQLLFAYYFFFVVYWYSLDFLDLFPAPGDLKIIPFDLFIYANSPVYEEVYYRIILLGIPLLVLLLIFCKIPRSETSPLRYIFGGGIRIGFIALILLFLSSMIFALAHVNKSIYYFPPIFLIGLMFGYLFLEKGIHTAIVLHFSVTYFDMLIFADNSGHVSGVAELFVGISVFARYLIIGFGIAAGPFYFLWYGRSALIFCANRIRDIREK